MTMNDNATLYLLGDRGQTIDGQVNDIRGREVKDANGVSVGKMTDLLIDSREQKVRLMLLKHGGFTGFGETRSLIPVETITKITEHEVLIDQSNERVAIAPAYAPHFIDDKDNHAGIYEHFGYAPYWGFYDLPTTDGMHHR